MICDPIVIFRYHIRYTYLKLVDFYACEEEASGAIVVEVRH